jgi:hypothetical protein
MLLIEASRLMDKNNDVYFSGVEKAEICERTGMAKASVYNSISELVKKGFFTKIVPSVYKVKVPVDDLGEDTCSHLNRPAIAKPKSQASKQKEAQDQPQYTSHTEVVYQLPNDTAFVWSGETSKKKESLELFLEFINELLGDDMGESTCGHLNK